MAATAVSGDYLIGPGDEIIVKIYSSAIDLDQRFTVSREGVIVLPGVGPVDLAGVRAANLEKRLKAVLSKRHKILVWDLRSQMIQDPSPLAETACELSLLIWMDQTLLLCSFNEASMT